MRGLTLRERTLPTRDGCRSTPSHHHCRTIVHYSISQATIPALVTRASTTHNRPIDFSTVAQSCCIHDDTFPCDKTSPTLLRVIWQIAGRLATQIPQTQSTRPPGNEGLSFAAAAIFCAERNGLQDSWYGCGRDSSTCAKRPKSTRWNHSHEHWQRRHDRPG